ncbi:hypothetical protein TNCV_3097241 [Trichonephila clavipes]|uniref:Uncharacterized protein n=1 Tax=Trichonephila clavipes TaxID=2585209 RepID=A0A8X6VMM8_TRICX|nr:hypothetical protein TNCV_3097241 [Trichonephila clavipes]
MRGRTGVDANPLRNPFVCGRLGPPRVKVKRESESALLEWAFVMGFSADTGHSMSERNVRCDPTPGWGESY